MPRVTVIVPTYNRASMIERAVRRALAQTFTDLEVIVVDDGSTDATGCIIEGIAKEDSRLRYLKHDVNKGMQAARNTGVRAAQGEFIAILDSDAEWLPEKVATQVALFDRDPKTTGVVFVSFLATDSQGNSVNGTIRHIRGNVYKDVLARCSPAPTSTLMMRKECFDRFGLFDERIPCWTEDDMCMIFSREFEFDFDNKPLVIDHYHTGERVSTNYARSARGRLAITDKHRAAILEHCGRRTLSWHYQIAGQLFLEAGDLASAKQSFRKSFNACPFCPTSAYYMLFLHIAPKQIPLAYGIKKRIGQFIRSVVSKPSRLKRRSRQ